MGPCFLALLLCAVVTTSIPLSRLFIPLVFLSFDSCPEKCPRSRIVSVSTSFPLFCRLDPFPLRFRLLRFLAGPRKDNVGKTRLGLGPWEGTFPESDPEVGGWSLPLTRLWGRLASRLFGSFPVHQCLLGQTHSSLVAVATSLAICAKRGLILPCLLERRGLFPFFGYELSPWSLCVPEGMSFHPAGLRGAPRQARLRFGRVGEKMVPRVKVFPVFRIEG